MATSVPVQIIHQLVGALNAHDAQEATQTFAPQYRGLDISRSASCEGPNQVGATLANWFQAFPDVQFTIQKMVREANRVVVFWTMEGTHEDTFLRVPPTHQRVVVSGFGLFVIEDGKIVRGIHLWDMAGMLRAMRLLPDLPGISPDSVLSHFLASPHPS